MSPGLRDYVMLAACFPLTFFKQTISHTPRYFRLIFCLIPSCAFRCTADFMGDRCQYHDVFNLLDEIKGIYGAGFKAGLSSSRHELLQCECCDFLYACTHHHTNKRNIHYFTTFQYLCNLTHLVETYFQLYMVWLSTFQFCFKPLFFPNVNIPILLNSS